MKIERIIKMRIKKCSNVFIMGHNNLDLDAISSCIGLSIISSHFNKKSYIIIDEEKHEYGVKKVLEKFKNDNKFIKSNEVSKYKDKDSILLITDVNKSSLLQDENIIDEFDKIFIIDHHQLNNQTIEKAVKYIDETSSSASEIVTYFIKKYRINITENVATILLSGIILDTNNFKLKTNPKTYYAAYYLASKGAKVKIAQSFLKHEIKNYIKLQKIITNYQIIKDKYAICIAPENEKYKREELAKAADTLIQFVGIETSFVLGNRVDGGIGLSARSSDNVNVGLILEKVGGGGDHYEAAAHITDMNIDDVKEIIINDLK